jgi:hypothetical protein
MSLLPPNPMKPMIIIPPGLMAQSEIKLLRDNGICVVTAKDPAKIKFVDPLPAASSRTQIEDAAIKLSRTILKQGTYNEESRANMAKMFVDLVVSGTALDPRPSQAEAEKREYDQARLEEVRRLAREDAKAEHLAKKSKAEAQKEKPK